MEIKIDFVCKDMLLQPIKWAQRINVYTNHAARSLKDDSASPIYIEKTPCQQRTKGDRKNRNETERKIFLIDWNVEKDFGLAARNFFIIPKSFCVALEAELLSGRMTVGTCAVQYSFHRESCVSM
jgi:hypothetical protein